MPTNRSEPPKSRFVVRELGPATWPDFVRIMEKYNGVWGGCWCLTFHLGRGESNHSVESRRAQKERLVRSNRSHSALVYDGTDVAGWCQFGSPAELPARMGGSKKLGTPMPDWRITCFFVDRDHRKEGIAAAALAGALEMIAARGGGTVDGYPLATKAKPYSSSFLWGGTESMFAKAGFEPLGALGSSKLVMRRTV